MRRFFWIAGLLFGLSGNRYVRSVRLRVATPIVQPVALAEPGRTVRTSAWWLA